MLWFCFTLFYGATRAFAEDRCLTPVGYAAMRGLLPGTELGVVQTRSNSHMLQQSIFNTLEKLSPNPFMMLMMHYSASIASLASPDPIFTASLTLALERSPPPSSGFTLSKGAFRALPPPPP